MKNFSILLSTVAVILAAVSLVMSSKKNEVSVSEPTVSAEQVAEILKDKPEMVVEALNAFQVKQEEERLKAENERRLKYKDEINSSANAGVRLIASTHASSYDELLNKSILEDTFKYKIFDYALGVKRNEGEFKYIFSLYEL